MQPNGTSICSGLDSHHAREAWERLANGQAQRAAMATPFHEKLCHLTSSRWAVLCKLTMFTLNRHDGLTVILTTFEADRLATPYDDNSKTMPFEMVQGL